MNGTHDMNPPGSQSANGENNEAIHPSAIFADRLAASFVYNEQAAGVGWWIVGVLALLGLIAAALIEPIRTHTHWRMVVDRGLLVLLPPILIVAISQMVETTRTEKFRVVLFSIVATLTAALVAGWTYIPHRQLAAWFGPDRSKMTAEDFENRAAHCLSIRDLDCAQEEWLDYIRLRPNDGKALANLGIVYNMKDAHADAVVQFQKAIELGEGAYDLFGYYADSLEKLGRIDEAIDWNYRALSVYPQLLDVRGKLATLLTLKKKYHEALTLLMESDELTAARGNLPYFYARRMSIESLIDSSNQDAAAPQESLRLPMASGHYFVSVKVGDAPKILFLVDTGASYATLSEPALIASHAKYKVLRASGQAFLADGHAVPAKLVSVQSLQVGPFKLENVPMMVCPSCLPLLGQATLSHFNMQSTKSQGVEFLTLTQR